MKRLRQQIEQKSFNYQITRGTKRKDGVIVTPSNTAGLDVVQLKVVFAELDKIVNKLKKISLDATDWIRQHQTEIMMRFHLHSHSGITVDEAITFFAEQLLEALKDE